MNKHSGLTNKQWQLLSAYLDNQLSGVEKQQVDELLKINPESRHALEQLRRTRVMLSCLPPRRVPRNFLVTQDMVPKPILPSLFGILRYSSAVSVLLLVIVLALDFLPGFQMKFELTREEPSEAQSMVLESARAPEQEGPVIIYWGAPAPIVGAYGKGGGGGGMGGIGGGAEGIDGGAPMSEPAVITPPEAPVDIIETLPESIQEESQLAEESQAPEVQGMEDKETAKRVPLSGTGPILGIPPEEMQGQIINPDDSVQSEQPLAFPVPLRTLEIILAALAVVTAIPVFFCSKKR